MGLGANVLLHVRHNSLQIQIKTICRVGHLPDSDLYVAVTAFFKRPLLFKTACEDDLNSLKRIYAQSSIAPRARKAHDK